MISGFKNVGIIEAMKNAGVGFILKDLEKDPFEDMHPFKDPFKYVNPFNDVDTLKTWTLTKKLKLIFAQ